MGLDIDTILDQVASPALAVGWFDRVGLHEPKNPPGLGLTVAIWMQSIKPIQSSGLSQTSALVLLNARLYTSMLQEPQDAIDPNLTKALSALFAAYSADFTLGANVRGIDLLGQLSQGMTATAGYLNQDGAVFRVYTVELPLIVDDVWEQTP